jgi:hypothetical protein
MVLKNGKYEETVGIEPLTLGAAFWLASH